MNDTVKKVVFILSLSLVSGLGYRWYMHHYAFPSDHDISEYIPARDKAFIKQMFKDNWYTLIASPGYDIDFMLEHKVPSNHELQYMGQMDIKMLHENGTPVGFITYFMASRYQGAIRFLVIAPEFRGKRYGERLLNYAFAHLKAQGAKTVKIYTRTENVSAQTLYKRVGFVPSEILPEGLYLRKEL